MRRLLALILCLGILISVLGGCNSPKNGGEGTTSPTDDNSSVESNPSGAATNPGGEAADLPLDDRGKVLAPLNNDFRSRTEVTYSNINGKDVTAYTLYREPNDGMNNPNFAQAVMLWQCLQYKIAHPEERVVATFSTFHLSVYAAACLDTNSPEYGRMENLYDKEYDEASGYYRVSWLMVDAARHGVEMLVIGDLDASGVYMSDGTIRYDADFFEYFTNHLTKDSLISGKKVGDFLTLRRADWTSYGDKAATDMMHLKLCTVSHRLANDGTEKGAAVWIGSINLDGVNDLGINGHNSIQSGVVISEHEEIRRVAVNYMNLLKDYCGQEDVTAFRDLVISRTTEQVALLGAGRGAEIALDEQIVYMGTENDSVFEFYFTPFGGAQNQWDVVHNPFCRYLGKLLASADGENAIQLIWNNVKFKQSFGLANTMATVIANAFRRNAHAEDILLLQLPELNTETFADLPENENIVINQTNRNYHIKDLQLSYVEDGERHWVVIYNTLNMHEGSMAYQSNLMLVVKETEATGNNFYTDYVMMTNLGTDFEKYRVNPK